MTVEEQIHEMGVKARAAATALRAFTTEQKNAVSREVDETERERVYTRRQIENALKKSGFEICGVFSGDRFDSFEPASDCDDRWMFVAKAVK